VKVEIDIYRQRLQLVSAGDVLMDVPVSTAANGVGELSGSECTPRGAHIIRAKIGAGSAVNTVFRGRRATGEIYTTVLSQQQPGRDWILTRILWLSGVEIGQNRLGEVDTMRRYIYIHGCPDETDMTVPGSHGCIRVRNDDILCLYEKVDVGTEVNII